MDQNLDEMPERRLCLMSGARSPGTTADAFIADPQFDFPDFNVLDAESQFYFGCPWNLEPPSGDTPAGVPPVSTSEAGQAQAMASSYCPPEQDDPELMGGGNGSLTFHVPGGLPHGPGWGSLVDISPGPHHEQLDFSSIEQLRDSLLTEGGTGQTSVTIGASNTGVLVDWAPGPGDIGDFMDGVSAITQTSFPWHDATTPLNPLLPFDDHSLWAADDMMDWMADEPMTFEYGNFNGLAGDDVPMEQEPQNDPKRGQPSSPSTSQRQIIFSGPPRPVTLPPARKGGRRGPMPQQQKGTRQQARDQGVCIRCRLRKKACSGGIPCTVCLKAAKSTLWMTPCTKAHFADLVELEPYFYYEPDIDELLKTLDRDTLRQYITTAHEYARMETGGTSRTTLRIMSDIKGFVDWDAAGRVLADIQAKGNWNNGVLSRPKLIEIIRCRIKSPNIAWNTGVSFSLRSQGGSHEEWIATNLLFCASKCISRRSDEASPGEGFLETGLKIQVLLTWISRRQFEVYLFHWMQRAVNKLRSLSDAEKVDIAAAMLRVLVLGCVEYSGKAFGHSVRDPAVCPDSLKELRMALLSYLRITLGLLPADSDFWKRQLASLLPITPKVLKDCMSESDVFGARDSIFVLRFKRWANWVGPLRPTGLGQVQDVRVLDPSHWKTHHILRNLMCGEHLASEVIDVRAMLDEYYKPLLNHLLASARAGTRVFESREMSILEVSQKYFADSSEMLANVHCLLVGCFERRANEDEVQRHAEEMINLSLTIMANLDQTFETHGVCAVAANLVSKRQTRSPANDSACFCGKRAGRMVC